MPKEVRTISLQQRDIAILRDIYEFYFLDHFTALKRYFRSESLNRRSAHHTFNRRMRMLAGEDLVTPTPFFSERRRADRGSSNYAYTLTKDGLQLLSDHMDSELEWETSRKTRKNPYIQHHLNVLYYVYLYSQWIEEGYLEDYFGEQSSRYQRLNSDGVLKDFVKPDGTILFRQGKAMIPWLVEYERDSRTSKSTILTKLSNYAKYFTSAYYKDHPVLTEQEANTPPVFLLYCENAKVAHRRLDILNQAKLKLFDSESAAGPGDFLIGIQEQIEDKPFEAVYSRLTGERVRIAQVNTVQELAQAFTAQSCKWYPSFTASRGGVYVDGVIHHADGKAMLRYFPVTADQLQMEKELDLFLKALASDNWKKHPYLQGEQPVHYLFVTESADQEAWLHRKIVQIRSEHSHLRLWVGRSDLVASAPFSNWLQQETGVREALSL